MKYRPEIDGLRAVAVVAVVFYHAQFSVRQTPIFEGGFLGVDVFFVISGYLICSIILRGIEDKNFSFSHFYERRVRRILPVLMLVMAVTTYLGWRYLLPNSLAEYANSLLSALAFFSNVWFWREDSYTADASAFKPLLHTWSLAIEEQFYLLFPPLLLLLCKFAKKHLFSAFVLLFGTSFFAACYVSYTNPSAAFYLLPFRSWELLAGAMLAYAEIRKQHSPTELRAELFSLLGVALLGISIFTFNEQTPHPSWPTLLPVLGTALIIWYSNSRNIVGRVLSTKALVGIGLISYSLYLWHFPLFAIARTAKSETTNGDFVGLIGLALALSTISYYVIEKPFRNSGVVSKKLLYSFCVVGGASLISLNIWITSNEGFPARLGVVAGLFEGLKAKDLHAPGSLLVRCIDSSGRNSCTNTKYTLLGIGDSHLNMLTRTETGLPSLAKDSYASLFLPGCPMITGVYKWVDKTPLPECEEAAEKVDAFLKRQAPLTLVYSARMPLHLSGKRFDNREGGTDDASRLEYITATEIPEPNMDGLEDLIHETFKRWLSYGHTIVLIYPVPEVGWDLPRYIASLLNAVDVNSRAELYETLNVTTDYSVVSDRNRATNLIYDSLGDNERLLRIRPEEIFCSKVTMRCITHDRKGLFYRDSNHLSPYGSSLVVKKIEEEMDSRSGSITRSR